MRIEDTLPESFRLQGDFCEEFGSHFTAELCRNAAISFEHKGVVYDLLKDWPGHPIKDALALRLTGALHAANLLNLDPALKSVYPAQCEGASSNDVWAAAEAFLKDHFEWTKDFLKSAPQTNETRRSLGLVAGFLHLANEGAAQPFHMLELGASAGLNQQWDRYHVTYGDHIWGASDGPPLDTDWEGPPPPFSDIEVFSRTGCDLNPLDVHSDADVLKLNAYIWPDQPERIERLNRAIEIARKHGVKIEKASADEWLENKLSGELPEGSTVVYHSIFFQYPPKDVRDRIASLIEDAGKRADDSHQLHWVRFEPASTLLVGDLDLGDIVLDTISWPGRNRTTRYRIDPHVRWVKPINTR